MFGEVLDVDAQAGVIHEPFVQALVASQEEEGGQEQERGCRKYRQECSQYSQTEGDAAQYGKDDVLQTEVICVFCNGVRPFSCGYISG